MSLQQVRFGQWMAHEIKKNVWKFFLPSDATKQYVLLTGGNNELDLQIPFFHTFQRIEITQNDSVDVASTDSLNFKFYKKTNTDKHVSKSRNTLIDESGLLVSDYGVNFTKDNFEREPTTYQFLFVGTNTNRVYPILYVEGEYKY